MRESEKKIPHKVKKKYDDYEPCVPQWIKKSAKRIIKFYLLFRKNIIFYKIHLTLFLQASPTKTFCVDKR